MPPANTATRTYRNNLGPDTRWSRTEFDDARRPRTEFDDARRSRTEFDDARRSRTEFDDARRSRTEFDDARRSRTEFDDARWSRTEFATNAWLAGSGIDADPWPGQGRDRARHRKPPSRRMRRAAAATAVALAGGGAAVGLLYATGPQPALSGADQNARTVTPGIQTAGGDGTAAALATPTTPVTASKPTPGYAPRHAAGSSRRTAASELTGTSAPPAGPVVAAGGQSAPAGSGLGSGSLGSSASPSASASASPSPSSSSGAAPSASPAPSSPTATASAPPTATAPVSTASGSCADPSFTTSAAFGSETLGAYTVSNNMWNAGGGGITQTLSACSAGDWSVDANVADDGGGVKTYPNSAYAFATPPEISSLASVTSTFGATVPASGTFDDAYDIWLNGTAGAGGDEVMIWTDNQGETPAGSQVATVTLDGQSYAVWQAEGGPITFVSSANVTAGDLNLLSFFQWLISNGYEPASSTLNQVAFGAQIESTGGADETFGFNNFSVSSS